MEVFVGILAPGVSITLAEESDGWRFVSWMQSGWCGGELAPPGEQDLQQRFATTNDALAFFRSICPTKL